MSQQSVTVRLFVLAKYQKEIIMARFSAKVFALLFITLLSACGGGSDGAGTTNLPPPANQAPIADAGADQTVSEAVVVTLQGAGVDADGSIASYSWVETSGTTVSLTDSDTETATFEAPMTVAQLTLTFELTVTDDQGATATDEVVIIVDPVMVTQTAVAGQELIITLDSAELVIPADALDAGVEVSVSIAEIETLAESPIGDGETLITPVYELTFSKRQIVSTDMQLSFDIPNEFSSAYFTRILIEGEIANHVTSDIRWLALLANYDQPSGRHIQSLSTTATRILITAMNRGASATNSLTSSNETKSTALSAQQQPGANAQLTASLRESNDSTLKTDTAFADYGWVIYCDPGLFETQMDSSCNPFHQDYQIMMDDLGAKVYASDKVLTELEHTHSKIKLSTKRDINSSVLGGLEAIIYDPDGRSDILGVDPLNYIYQVVQVDANLIDGHHGVFYGTSKILLVDIGEGDDTVIHELMHAVQLAKIIGEYKFEWIREGLASAVEDFAPSHPQLGKEFRMLKWRDWSAPLMEDYWAYETLELWLSIDTNFSNIDRFYFWLNFKDKKMTILNTYQLVDEALVEAGLPTLRDAYKDLISSRNLDSRYLHCESVTRSCTDESCEIVTPIPSMSASCFEVDVNFESCDDSPQDIVVSLVTAPGAIPNPNLELMVDSIIHPADTEVAFFGVGRIWAINTSYDDAGAGPPESATIKFDNKTEANCYMKFNRQYLIARANSAHVDGPADYNASEYYSFDDLSEQSFLIIPGERIDVEPLGLNPYSASHSSSYSWVTPKACDTCVGGETINLSSEATLSVEASIDSESMTINGQLDSMAMVEGNITGVSSADYETSAWARAIYYIEAVGVPLDMTLTWGCDLSKVAVRGIGETFITTNRDDGFPSNDWQCGMPFHFIIPAGMVAEINFDSSFFVVWKSEFWWEYYKNTGGAFEIKTQAILE